MKSIFQAVVESVLMYGSETWTPTRALVIQLDGCYTLLRTALNVDWRDHVTNEDLYGDLPRLSAKLRRKRLQFAGHCYRAKDEAVSRTVLWFPFKTYVDLLSEDIRLSGRELETTMLERCHWRDTIFAEKCLKFLSDFFPPFLTRHFRRERVKNLVDGLVS